jgi:hypothetical protein
MGELCLDCEQAQRAGVRTQKALTLVSSLVAKLDPRGGDACTSAEA